MCNGFCFTLTPQVAQNSCSQLLIQITTAKDKRISWWWTPRGNSRERQAQYSIDQVISYSWILDFGLSVPGKISISNSRLATAEGGNHNLAGRAPSSDWSASSFIMVVYESFFSKFSQNFVSKGRPKIFSQTTIIKPHVFTDQSEVSALPVGWESNIKRKLLSQWLVTIFYLHFRFSLRPG